MSSPTETKPHIKGSKNKRIAAVIAGIALFALYFQFFLKPAIWELSTIFPKVSELRKDLANSKDLISKTQLLKKKKERLNARMKEYEKIFPSEQEVPRLLEKLSNVAGESGVKIISIRPLEKEAFGQRKEPGTYREIPIEIVAKSGYHQLGAFLQKLETGERFIMVKELNISADSKDVTRHNIKLITSTYILLKK